MAIMKQWIAIFKALFMLCYKSEQPEKTGISIMIKQSFFISTIRGNFNSKVPSWILTKSRKNILPNVLDSHKII